MWTKYSYVCTDCDTLIEISTLKKLHDYQGRCVCGTRNLVQVAIEKGKVNA